MKNQTALCFLFCVLPLMASELEEFVDLTDLSGAEPILTENFNDGATGWSLPEGWSYVSREGLNGSGALKYVRQNPNNNKEATLPVALKPGIRYQLSLQYRSELKVEPDKERMEIFAIRYWDEKGRDLPGSFYNRKKMNSDQNDWESMSFLFQPPANMAKAALCLLMRTKRTGTLWFDDISIYPFSAEMAMLHKTGPQKLTLNAKGEISWRCVLSTPESPLELAVQATVGGRTRRIPVDANGDASACFGTFEPGRIPVEAKLLDLTGKRILAVDRGCVFVRQPDSILPTGNVEIDRDGRTLIDGKPFMPIGLFTGFIEKNDTGALRKIRDAGFNAILSIGYVNPYGGVKKTPQETLLALCDELQKLNLKYIFSIKNQLELSKGKKPRGRQQWGDSQGPGAVADMTVETLRKHPAMLAWYVSDENPLDEIPAICALRERISERDPWHPVLTLTDRIGNFQHFSKTGDVLLHDVYPIGGRTNTGPAQTLKTVQMAFAPAMKTGLPLWWVPQVFSWNSSSLEHKPRYPTVEEMRSQCLLAAIHGVKAFILYSWHHVMYYSEKNDPGHSAEQWERICKTVAILKELEPFIMSVEKAPEITIEKSRGNGVEAAAFKWGDKIRVMVVAIGPGTASAELVIPGYASLRSRSGRTKSLGGGRYLFEGEHVVSDILE